MSSPAATALPLPIAALLRRARNAKSPKERHDTAYHAWEASLRLAAAARLAAGTALSEEARQALAAPSVGAWVSLAAPADAPLDDGALLAAHALLASEAEGRPRAPQRTSARALLDLVPGYRNRLIGHGAPRPAAWYDPAAATLTDALPAAWRAGVFLEPGEALVYVDAIEIDPRGRRRARTLLLEGLGATLEASPSPGGGNGSGEAAHAEEALPDGVLPRRLYARRGARLRPLHPWVAFDADERLERTLFFNGRRRGAHLLDFLSGETVKGAALEARLPGIEADLGRALEGGSGGAGGASSTSTSMSGAVEAVDPDLFGDYRILGELGRGGMGVVSLARQESLGRLVALKRLPPFAADDPVARARFRREVDALSRCDHPNVVKILASGESRSTPYYAMELIEGADLAEVARALDASGGDLDHAISSASERSRRARECALEAKPKLPMRKPGSQESSGSEDGSGLPGLLVSSEPVRPDPTLAAHHAARTEATRDALRSGGGAVSARERARRLAAFMRDAARALDHVHARGIVHRDVKPGNLMITAADRRVVLMDLGLAALGDASRSITVERGGLLGTLRYTAPEQLTRNLAAVDRRADIYALGATFYELLCGRPLFDGETEARLIQQVLREAPTPPARANPALPADLAVILSKALEKDPARRYESAEALAKDLDALLDGRPISARPPTFGYLAALAIRRSPGTSALAALVLALVVAATALFVRSESERRRMAEATLEVVGGANRRAEAARQAAEQARERAITSEREAQVLLGRVFLEKADRAMAERDHAAAELLFAKALTREDTRETRMRLVSARALGATLLWTSPRATYGPHVAASADGRALLVEGAGGRVHVLDAATLREATIKRPAMLGRVRPDPGPSTWERALVSTGLAARPPAGPGAPSPRIPRLDPPLTATPTAVVPFGPGDRLLAIAAPDRPLTVVDAVTGALVARAAGHAGLCADMVVTRDGRLVASSGYEGSVIVRDAATGRERAAFRAPAAVAGLAFAPDGRRIAAACADGRARVYAIEPPGLEAEVAIAPRQVWSVAWSPDGTRLAAGCIGGGAFVVPLAPGGATPTALWDVSAADVRTVAWLPDGRRVATGGSDGHVRIHDAETGISMQQLTGRDVTVNDVVFDPRGRSALVAFGDGRVMRWFLADDQMIAIADAGPEASDLSLDAAGDRIAVARDDGTLEVHDAAFRRPMTRRDSLGGTANGIALSPDGRRVYVASGDGVARAFAVEAAPEARAHHQGVITRFFEAGPRRIALARERGPVQVLDPDDGRVLDELPEPRGRTASVIAPGGARRLDGADASTSAWEIRGRAGPPVRLPGLGVTLTGPVFRPDGRRVAATDSSGIGLLWDAESGARLAATRLDASTPNCALAYSHDGARLFALIEREVWELDPETLARARRIHEGDMKLVGLCGSPDGAVLALCRSSSPPVIVDARTGALLQALEGPALFYGVGRFTPDGGRVAFACDDGAARVYDVRAGGAPLVRIDAHLAACFDVAFLDGGAALASAGRDGALRIFDLAQVDALLAAPVVDLLADAERRTGLRITTLDPEPIPQGRLCRPGEE